MLLDTNAYSALARGIQSVIERVNDVIELTLPLPVIAELRYGFVKGSQTLKNEHTLQEFLSQPQISVAMPTLQTTKIYADFQLWCVRHGKSLSQNDIWIAALAKERDDALITFDRDFEVFLNLLGDKLIILTE
jgi:predicted nucleic acid-binding protein